MIFPLPYENDLSNEEKQDIDNFIEVYMNNVKMILKKLPN